MSKIRQLIQEKFGYTTNLPKYPKNHEDVTERNGRDGKNPAYKPVEAFRQVIKHLMGATNTEEEGKIENAIDFTALKRLANKYAFAPAFVSNLNVMQLEIEKPDGKKDREKIAKAWNEIKEKVPYWFLGLLPKKDGEPLPEDDKKKLTNLMEIMAEFNKEGEKRHKEFAGDTEHAGREADARKNLKDALKDSDAGKELKASGDEKDLKKKPEDIKTEHKDEKAIDKVEKEAKVMAPGDKGPENLKTEKKEEKKEEKKDRK